MFIYLSLSTITIPNGRNGKKQKAENNHSVTHEYSTISTDNGRVDIYNSTVLDFIFVLYFKILVSKPHT